MIDVPAGTVVRVAPGTVRSVWDGRAEEAALVIVSTRIADARDVTSA